MRGCTWIGSLVHSSCRTRNWFDLSQRPLLVLRGPLAMNSPNQAYPEKEASAPIASRSEEALRVIEEYAKGLQEIIKKLRRYLN